MNTLRIWWARFLGQFRKQAGERELADELQFHFESEIAMHRARGLTEAEARAAAHKRFGGVDLHKEAYRDARGLPALEAIGRSLRYGLRTLRANPAFTAVAIASLALGIGLTTAIFSLAIQAIFPNIPARAASRLVVIHREGRAEGNSSADTSETVLSHPLYLSLRDSGIALEGMIARAAAEVGLGYGGSTEPIAAEIVSGNYFPQLGLKPFAGRLLTEQDDGAPGANPVAVLSHRYWSKRFQDDLSIVNRTVTINNHPMTVLGIAPPEFRGLQPGDAPDLYVPISMLNTLRPTFEAFNDPMTHWLSVFAWTKPGLSREQADTLFRAAFRRSQEAMLEREPRLLGGESREVFLARPVTLLPAAHGINQLSGLANPLVAILIMSALVLAIACANVAGLMIARAVGRQREIAIRYAVGATRRALIQQFLVEGLLISVPAGALGILVAAGSVRVLLATLPAGFSGNWFSPEIDPRMLAFATATACLCGIAFSLAPAFQGTKQSSDAVLRGASTRIAGTGNRLRQSMVAGQVALSLLLLVAAALLGTSLYRLSLIDVGFRAEQLLAVGMNASTTRPQPAQTLAYYRDLEARLKSLPGVTGVALAQGGPFSGSNSGGGVTVESYEAQDARAQRVLVNAEFFQTMGIRLREGRQFTSADTETSQQVAIVNETFARRYFGSASPVGKRMQFSRTNQPKYTHTIIGLISDFKKRVRDEVEPTAYLPYVQRTSGNGYWFYVRYAGDAAQITPRIRAAGQSVDASVALSDVTPMTTSIAREIALNRVIAYLAVAFGLLAMALAAIGLYGVVAYNASRRTSEIGVRLALGAARGNVLRMILKEAAVTIAIGLAIGFAGVLALARLLESQLFGVQATDPRAIAASLLVLGCTALFTAFLPAWRASRIDPMSALRHE